jgi:hypothetical protein
MMKTETVDDTEIMADLIRTATRQNAFRFALHMWQQSSSSKKQQRKKYVI